jgi:asparagine synthase (glutamine-hydrolysing)
MCGIHGFISDAFSKKQALDRLSKMGKVQLHRGPDDQQNQVFCFEKSLVGFGFVRLSILDLQTGMQPIRCPVDDTTIICNGQIYNYLELKSMVSSEPFVTKGDIEVALHMYRKKGIGFLNELNGMYAGAIFDPEKNTLLLFRDRFGIKPLYYTKHKGSFFFASEIKPLISGSNMVPELNEKELGTFFSYRYLAGKNTMFKEIYRLPPGSYLEYDLKNGNYRVARYWEYKLNCIDPNISMQQAEEEFFYLFSDAVKIRMRSDVEVGCFLSGGIDSSAVAERAALHHPHMKLFSMSFAESEYDELPMVRRFVKSKQAHFKHVQHMTQRCGKETLNMLPELIRTLEEPISLGTIFPTHQVCQLAADYVKVVLTGEGADEIFGGYRKFLLEMAAVEYPLLSSNQQRKLHREYPELASYLKIRDTDPVKRYIQNERLFTSDELATLLGTGVETDHALPLDALPFLDGTEHPLNAAIAMESRFRLPNYVILRLDKISMSHSLEARTPFLDYRLAEFAAKLPVRLKIDIDLEQEKVICRNTFINKGILDKETSSRKKQPFTIPLPNWLSEPEQLPDFLKDILSGNMVKQQGILNPEMVIRLANKVSSKGTGPSTLVSEADRLFAVCVFTLWYKEFINF